MTTLAISNLEMIDETTADSDLKPQLETIKKDMQLPFVPNLFKTLAGSETALKGGWAAFDHLFLQNSLPVALKAMVLYTIASTNACKYCSSVHQATCKSLGVDEDTLKMLTENLSDVEPRRVQAIVDFAVKVSQDGTSLKEEDYDEVRDQGVTEEELVEIIGLAALGNFLDTLADAFKIDVDGPIKNALGMS